VRIGTPAWFAAERAKIRRAYPRRNAEWEPWEDLVIVRLVTRLEKAGVSGWTARAARSYVDPVAAKLQRTRWGVLARVATLRVALRREASK
jgi:hypothetical protein